MNEWRQDNSYVRARKLKMLAKRIILVLVLTSVPLVYFICFVERISNLEDDTRWIQSSERVYFLKDDNSSHNSLYSIRLNGQELKKIVNGPIHYFLLSPDGQKIAYLLDGNSDSNGVNCWDRGCGIFELNTETIHKISNTATDIDWDPSSTKVTFNRDEHSIDLYDMISQKKEEIARIADDIIIGPRWSKDGSKLFFNTLFCKCYYELRLGTKRITRLEPISNSSEQKGNNKNKYWSDFVDLTNMHFNQSGVSGYSYDEKRSPSGAYWIANKKGSLVLLENNKTKETTIMKYIGSFNPDFGHWGVTKPVWTKDERYVLGDFKNTIVVADIVTKRSGILTIGNSPITYLPNYYPADTPNEPMYYIFMK